jgi:hypothetical protein
MLMLRVSKIGGTFGRRYTSIDATKNFLPKESLGGSVKSCTFYVHKLVHYVYHKNSHQFTNYIESIRQFKVSMEISQEEVKDKEVSIE